MPTTCGGNAAATTVGSAYSGDFMRPSRANGRRSGACGCRGEAPDSGKLLRSSNKGLLRNAAQEPSLYTRPYAPTSCRADRHGVVCHAPPHRGLPRLVHSRAGGHEGFHRHAERRVGTGFLGDRRDGRLGLKPDLARATRCWCSPRASSASAGAIWPKLLDAWLRC